MLKLFLVNKLENEEILTRVYEKRKKYIDRRRRKFVGNMWRHAVNGATLHRKMEGVARRERRTDSQSWRLLIFS